MSLAGSARELDARALRQRAWLMAVAAAILFSTGGAAVKAASLTSWQVASLRCGVAALALPLLLPSARRRPPLRIWPVALAYAGTLTCFVVATKWTTAANAIFLQSTAPLYVLCVAPWVLKERIRGRDLLYMVFLAAGMALFFLGAQEPTATAPRPLAGNLVGVVTGMCWGMTVLGLRWLESSGNRDAPGAAGPAVLAGSVLAFVVCLPAAWPLTSISLADAGAVIFLGVVQIALAYRLLTSAVRHLPALEVSLLLLMDPVLNPLWAWLFHRETPEAWAVVGCTVILLATAGHLLLSSGPASKPPATGPAL
ncbi:MAG: DMT family transporter [Acidobacteriota bacterium]|nr:DMT family transporter [Acidobacteriota bacterium]